jgi:glycosyltransferase involved in cell wall biosynthesis
MSPKASVIMPNYNKGEHLKWAIKSVLSQTIYDIELVIVDDSSNDSSLAVIEEFRKDDSRILLRANTENLGPAACLNVGLRASSAGIVTFLGSDDLFSKDRIERQLQIINKHENEVVVYSDPITIDSNLSSIDSIATNRSFRPSGWIFPYLIAERFSFHGAVTGLSRASFEKVGFFDESLRWGEDLEMCLRLAKVYEFSYDPVATYGYRRHVGNTIQRISRADRYRYQSQIIEKHLFANFDDLDTQTKGFALDGLFSSYVASGQWGKVLERGFSSRVGLMSLMKLPLRAAFS